MTVSGASVARARRARVRRDVTVPRALVSGALAGALVLAAVGFAAGWWVGRDGAAGEAGARLATVVREAPEPPATAIGAEPVPSRSVEPAASPSPSVEPIPSTAPVASMAPVASAAPVASTAPVASPVSPSPEAAPPVARPKLRPPPTSRGFGVQLGAFEREAEALAFVDAHAAAIGDLPVFVVPTVIEGRGTWYRVRLADVKTRAAADTIRLRLAPVLAERAIVVSHK